MAGVFNSRAWYRYRSEPLAVFGLGLLSAIVFLAVLAPVVTPYPDHAGRFVDFSNTSQPPNAQHWFGTDLVGRDVLTRVIYGYRISLVIGSSCSARRAAGRHARACRRLHERPGWHGHYAGHRCLSGDPGSGSGDGGARRARAYPAQRFARARGPVVALVYADGLQSDPSLAARGVRRCGEGRRRLPSSHPVPRDPPEPFAVCADQVHAGSRLRHTRGLGAQLPGVGSRTAHPGSGVHGRGRRDLSAGHVVVAGVSGDLQSCWSSWRSTSSATGCAACSEKDGELGPHPHGRRPASPHTPVRGRGAHFSMASACT